MNFLTINTTLNDRLHALAKAGSELTQYINKQSNPASHAIDQAVQLARLKNPWFTLDNIIYALDQWASALTVDALRAWTSGYDFESIKVRNVAVITAGNLPLVGLHDILSVIITGHHAIIKNSSNDDVLTPMLLDLATQHLPELAQSYSYIKGKLSDYDAVIATGSDNTARYFEYYFGSKPHIIRKNRNSIAVLTGDETLDQMQALSYDVFRYFGLGCRSVSHLMVPRDYNFDLFFNGMYTQKDLIHNDKYLNNYDYNKAVYLMSNFELLDNEFLIMKQETSSYASPIASLGYRYYDQITDLAQQIVRDSDQLQCVVAHGSAASVINNSIAHLSAPVVVDFGQTQCPKLTDYADGIDTVNFLLKLS